MCAHIHLFSSFVLILGWFEKALLENDVSMSVCVNIMQPLCSHLHQKYVPLEMNYHSYLHHVSRWYNYATLYTPKHIYICIYIIYIHTCMHACMHTYIHTYKQTYISLYIYIYNMPFGCGSLCRFTQTVWYFYPPQNLTSLSKIELRLRGAFLSPSSARGPPTAVPWTSVTRGIPPKS